MLFFFVLFWVFLPLPLSELELLHNELTLPYFGYRICFVSLSIQQAESFVLIFLLSSGKLDFTFLSYRCGGNSPFLTEFLQPLSQNLDHWKLPSQAICFGCVCLSVS